MCQKHAFFDLLQTFQATKYTHKKPKNVEERFLLMVLQKCVCVQRCKVFILMLGELLASGFSLSLLIIVRLAAISGEEKAIFHSANTSLCHLGDNNKVRCQMNSTPYSNGFSTPSKNHSIPHTEINITKNTSQVEKNIYNSLG